MGMGEFGRRRPVDGLAAIGAKPVAGFQWKAAFSTKICHDYLLMNDNDQTDRQAEWIRHVPLGSPDFDDPPNVHLRPMSAPRTFHRENPFLPNHINPKDTINTPVTFAAKVRTPSWTARFD